MTDTTRGGDGGRGDRARRDRAQGITKTFHAHGDAVAAVKGVDVTIGEGEFFSLLGPSGCGKTTTMRMIAGFDEPTEGEVFLHGKNVVGVPPNKRDVNMVFQSYALFPHMNVLDNVAFGLRRKGVGKDEAGRRAAEMLEIVDLKGRENAGRASCPAVSSSGSRWPAPWSTGRARSCWTSRSARSTSSSARPCRSSSSASSARSASRSCT